VSTFVAALAILPAVLSAQQPPPPRPPRPAPPAPMAPVAPPTPVAPPSPWTVLAPVEVPMPLVDLFPPSLELALPMVAPLPALAPLAPMAVEFDQMAIADAMRAAQETWRGVEWAGAEEAREAARAAVAGLDVAAIRDQAREASRLATSEMRHAWEAAELAGTHEGFFERSFAFEPQSQDSGGYNSAMSALNARRYEDAVTRFDRVIAQKGSHADAALYWKAFAQFRLGRSSDALETIAQLRRDHAQSAYTREARVLEADVKRSSGQPVNPAAISDDEIKLLAISGIQKSDPERAIPLLEGVLNATNSLEVKRRALYVLALSDQPRAHEILMSYAKGGGTPDLQRTAISYIASRRDRQTTSADLRDIYASTSDDAVKVAIINAYAQAGDKAALVAIASNTSAPMVVRSSAVSGLQQTASPQDIWALYQKEPNVELRTRMLSVLSSMRASDLLIQAARTEREPAVRQRAIRYLGSQRPEVTGQTLVDLYAGDLDVNGRKAVISALSSQNNAEGLVTIARRENSLELTRDIVSRLSDMAAKSKVAADYLMEIIKR
jgi:hypothetical protein